MFNLPFNIFGESKETQMFMGVLKIVTRFNWTLSSSFGRHFTVDASTKLKLSIIIHSKCYGSVENQVSDWANIHIHRYNTRINNVPISRNQKNRCLFHLSCTFRWWPRFFFQFYGLTLKFLLNVTRIHQHKNEEPNYFRWEWISFNCNDFWNH